MIDGRYVGGNDTLALELRVDLKELGVVSGDLSRDRRPVASMRTAPGIKVTATTGQWPMIWRDSAGVASTGTVALAPGDGDGTLAVTLRWDQRPQWRPPRSELSIVVRRVGGLPRELGLEVETELGVQPPAPVAVAGAAVDKREALRAAGFAVRDVGERTAVPHRADGWDYANIYTVLHDLMTASAQAMPTGPDWDLRLLMLSRCTEPRLAGVMFDSTDPLPRQGVAVFVDSIRDNPPADVEVDVNARIIRTTVHEIGHALNLVHRFERRVGRRDSTSYMNYPRHFLSGGTGPDGAAGDGSAGYWSRFGFRFDRDELEFLRHGYWPAVVPGGDRFASVTYWADGGGGYEPYAPELTVSTLRLTLAPPAAGPVFAFGQPVFLEVTLENLAETPFRPGEVPFGPWVLDPKLGWLEITVQRLLGPPGAAPTTPEPFTPIVHGCELDELPATELPAGGSWRDNLNLTFGSGGFPFAEPGTYLVTPWLTRFVSLNGEDRELVVRGEPLRIRIGYPHDARQERDALVLLRPDVGAWFALGGADSLDAAGEDLAELAQRRHAVRGPADPIAATITRAAGIDAGREYVRYDDDRFTVHDGDPEQAAALLGSLDTVALRCFDRSTAASTARLAQRYAELA